MRLFLRKYNICQFKYISMDFLFDTAMAICPVLGYIIQYRLILKNHSVGAFSIDICLVLLIANILRLNFYPFQHFETSLVFQSGFMIVAQLILLEVCTRYKNYGDEEEEESDNESTQVGEEERKGERFWRWNNFEPYWHSTVIFAVASVAVSLIMWKIDVQIYGELIGLVSLLTESMLILPQIIQICRQSNADGISYSMIGLNLAGDTFKTYYFFSNDQPFQFKLCGIIQLILDLVVISQLIYHRGGISKLTEEAEEEDPAKKQKELQAKQGIIDQLEGSLSHASTNQEQSETPAEEKLKQLQQIQTEDKLG